MPSRFAVALVAALVLSCGRVVDARAQETIFNVPSPDVLERGKLYLETDQYFRSWKIGSDRGAFFLLRGVLGVGRSAEVGFNSGSFDYLHTSEPFVDATVKWRLVRSGTTGLLVGDDAGVGLRGGTAGVFRNLAYAAGFATVARSKTRASAGPYCVTRDVFADRGRCGAQVTVEQPMPGVSGLELAGDWFSGSGAFATTGVIGSVHRLVFYAGYGFANAGRGGDLLTLELGVTLF